MLCDLLLRNPPRKREARHLVAAFFSSSIARDADLLFENALLHCKTLAFGAESPQMATARERVQRLPSGDGSYRIDHRQNMRDVNNYEKLLQEHCMDKLVAARAMYDMAIKAARTGHEETDDDNDALRRLLSSRGVVALATGMEDEAVHAFTALQSRLHKLVLSKEKTIVHAAPHAHAQLRQRAIATLLHKAHNDAAATLDSTALEKTNLKKVFPLLPKGLRPLSCPVAVASLQLEMANASHCLSLAWWRGGARAVPDSGPTLSGKGAALSVLASTLVTLRHQGFEDDHPDVLGVSYTLGDMLYKAGDYAGALRQWEVTATGLRRGVACEVDVATVERLQQLAQKRQAAEQKKKR